VQGSATALVALLHPAGVLEARRGPCAPPAIDPDVLRHFVCCPLQPAVQKLPWPAGAS